MANSNAPMEQPSGNTETFIPNRKVPLIIGIGAGGLLAWNHYDAMNSGRVSMAIIFIGPLFFLLGMGGVIDPRIAWSIGPRGQHFPLRIKVIGGILAVAGLVVSAYLALGVYRLQEVRTSNPPEIKDVSGSSQ